MRKIIPRLLGFHQQLATGFRRMAECLTKGRATLEFRVEERTRELQRSMARYDTLVARISAGVYTARFLADGKLVFEYLSPRFCQLLGQDEKALLDDPLHIFRNVHGDDAAQIMQLARDAAGAPAPFRHEFRFVLDGESRWYCLDADPTPLDDGGSYWNGTLTDISDRKRTEIALQASEARFRGVFERTNTGIIFADRRGQLLQVNDAFARLLGFEATALVGVNLAAITHADDMPAVFALFRDGNSGGDDFRIEKRYLSKSGSVVWVDQSITAIRDEKGRMSSFIGVSVDINERKKAEAAMRQANEELAAIFESATHGIAFVKDRVIVKCNRKLEDLFGYGPGELTGQSTRIWFLDDGGFHGGTKAYRALQRGGVQRWTVAVPRRDGVSFWCRFSGRAVAPSDLAAGTVWIIEDISQEHEAVQTMTEAREAAEAANRAKSEFLANMSHEIRTPMNAMLGLTQLVLEGELSAKQADHLRKAHNAGKTLLAILNDILDYSKIEADRFDIERVPLSIETLLQDVGDLFAADIAEKGLRLFRDVDPAVPPWVLGDPLRLTQVLNNLVANAVKFTERGEIRVRAEVAGAGDGVTTLRFIVRDTGIGLSPLQSEHLFEAFTQADGSITRKYGGTGLGLAICRKLTRLMGGDIAFDGEAGPGASFSFTVEVGTVATADAIAAPPSPTESGSFASLRFHGARVLLVEDNALNRHVAAEFLRRRGIVATVVNQGAEAVEQVRSARFDVVLMDLHMPAMDGLEATRRIRELPAGRDLPIVAMTAAVMPQDRERCVAAGMNGFVAKPIDSEDLARELGRWLTPTFPSAIAIPPARQTSPAPLPMLPGFDLVAALRRLDGNRQLLGHLLLEFAAEQAPAAVEITTMLASGRNQEAADRLHALGGAAANLGATAVAAAAQTLAQALARGEFHSSLPAFAASLDAAVAAIVARAGSLASHGGEEDAMDLAALLSSLRYYLEQRELVPDELLAALQALVATSPPEAPLAELLHRINRFDHDGALAAIVRIAAIDALELGK